MKIIKEGYLSPKEKYNIFECEKCGCIFKASENEYLYNYFYNTSLANCPWCNSVAIVEGSGIVDKPKNIFFSK